MNSYNRILSVMRGPGDSDKCSIVRDSISDASPTVVCLHETKLQNVNVFKAKSFLPSKFANSFTFVASDGARGGILTAWDPAYFSISFTLKITTPYQLC